MFHSLPRIARRTVIAILTVALGITFLGLAGAVSPVVAAAPQNECADANGVTVVVDFTDIGGEVTIGCAVDDPTSGRDALEQAGFTIAESQPGMICALNSLPDPCPAVFDGSFWSYWHRAPDGEWSSYLVGADSSDPESGDFEGWRYNDGSAGPSILPAEATTTLTTTATEDLSHEEEPATTTMPMSDILTVSAIAAIAIVTLVVFFMVWIRRRRTSDRS